MKHRCAAVCWLQSILMIAGEPRVYNIKFGIAPAEEAERHGSIAMPDPGALSLPFHWDWRSPSPERPTPDLRMLIAGVAIEPCLSHPIQPGVVSACNSTTSIGTATTSVTG